MLLRHSEYGESGTMNGATRFLKSPKVNALHHGHDPDMEFVVEVQMWFDAQYSSPKTPITVD